MTPEPIKFISQARELQEATSAKAAQMLLDSGWVCFGIKERSSTLVGPNGPVRSVDVFYVLGRGPVVQGPIEDFSKLPWREYAYGTCIKADEKGELADKLREKLKNASLFTDAGFEYRYVGDKKFISRSRSKK